MQVDMGGIGGMVAMRMRDTGRKSYVRQGGQVMVLFALVSVVLVGMVGLVVDSGTAYVHSRTLQDASDVAAESGDVLLTADLKTNTADNPLPYSTADICGVIETSISSTVTGTAASGSWQAYYTDLNGTVLGSAFCPSPPSGNPPSTAFGIKVTTTATSPTYFMGVLGINTTTQNSSGTAVVQQLMQVNTDGMAPFMAWYMDCTLSGGAQPLAPGDKFTFRYNNFMSKDVCDNPSSDPPSGAGFKGYFHYKNGTVSVGGSNPLKSQGGNAFGTDSMATVMDNAAQNQTPVLFPVADSLTGPSGSMSVQLSGFVEVLLPTDFARLSPSVAWTGTVVGTGIIPYSAVDTVCTSSCTYDSPNATTAVTLVG